MDGFIEKQGHFIRTSSIEMVGPVKKDSFDDSFSFVVWLSSGTTRVFSNKDESLAIKDREKLLLSL